MIDPEEVGILDENSAALGVDTAGLMDSAGRAFADEVVNRFPEGSSVLFVCGPGNNGGDGFVAAKYLIDSGYDARVVLIKDPTTELARFALMWSKIKPMKFRDVPRELFTSADLLVDALLGSGSKGDPRGEIADAIEIMNGSGPPVYSVDIPSGIGHSPCIEARLTVTFHDSKTNMYEEDDSLRRECGELIVRDIGIPPEAAEMVGPGDLRRYPIPEKSAHKGDMGKVLFVGGGPYTGAPALASMAILRSGADLVRGIVPNGIHDAIATFSPDLIVEGSGDPNSIFLGPESLEAIEAAIDWSDTVLIGPGAGRADGTLKVLLSSMEYAADKGKKMVVDADGLFALSKGIGRVKGRNILVTPHKGELRRLLDAIGIREHPSSDEDMVRKMSELSFRTGYAVLVKGNVDFILGTGKHGLGKHIEIETPRGKAILRRNTSGHPAMTKGGTGDVLAGICAGFMARGMTPFDAGSLAAYLNGKAGEAAFERKGYSMVASDMLDEIVIKV